MQTSTNLSALLAGRTIVVPDYQRAYSWDTDSTETRQLQVNVFLSDLLDHIKSNTSSPYYFGHFLFEEIGSEEYAIIDGQQRLTTSVIFLSALYKRLKEECGVESVMGLGDDLYVAYCNTIKQGSTYRFSTVAYDNQKFRDYVIDQTNRNYNDIDTVSKARFVEAFDFFTKKLAEMDRPMLIALHKTIAQALCTTYIVKSPVEAVQMFIFQNNRGKRPTNLEIIKAQFMYHIHLYAPEADKLPALKEVTERFEHIYRSIAQVEGSIDEDNVLTYTINVYRNTLGETNALDFVEDELAKASNCLDFILSFTSLLASCFVQVSTFFEEEKVNFTYHSLLVSATKGIMFPFVIKAMHNGMAQDDLNKLAEALEVIFLRHRIIGTRANLRWRLGDCYSEMEQDSQGVVDCIEDMKTAYGWSGYWNNDELRRCLNMGMNHNVAKILLWKYENSLIAKEKGYAPIRYDHTLEPQLEHIAPQTENCEPNNGYCPYDEEFNNEYLNTLGNYLLLSGPHNDSLSNQSFYDKRKRYTQLKQQAEVATNTSWGKEQIRERHEKIVNALLPLLGVK